MSNTIRKSDLFREYQVHTPDYPLALYLRNPDLSLLEGKVPEIYWKISGMFVVEMTRTEKNAANTNLPDATADIAAATTLAELITALGISMSYINSLELRLRKLEIEVLKGKK